MKRNLLLDRSTNLPSNIVTQLLCKRQVVYDKM